MSDKRERNGELGREALANWETPAEDLGGIRKFLLFFAVAASLSAVLCGGLCTFVTLLTPKTSSQPAWAISSRCHVAQPARGCWGRDC